MGICSSCESTCVATAKLILYDGRLQEFSYPVKASFVLQKHPTYFICNSDEMEFNDVISAISDDEILQPGELYFALPLDKMKRRMEAAEMAALAVKASSVLGGGDKCGFLFTEKRELKAGDFSGVSEKMVVKPRRSSGGGCRRGGKFKAELIAIPE